MAAGQGRKVSDETICAILLLSPRLSTGQIALKLGLSPQVVYNYRSGHLRRAWTVARKHGLAIQPRKRRLDVSQYNRAASLAHIKAVMDGDA
jgi:hypothetical protein